MYFGTKNGVNNVTKGSAKKVASFKDTGLVCSENSLLGKGTGAFYRYMYHPQKSWFYRKVAPEPQNEQDPKMKGTIPIKIVFLFNSLTVVSDEHYSYVRVGFSCYTNRPAFNFGGVSSWMGRVGTADIKYEGAGGGRFNVWTIGKLFKPRSRSACGGRVMSDATRDEKERQVARKKHLRPSLSRFFCLQSASQ